MGRVALLALALALASQLVSSSWRSVAAESADRAADESPTSQWPAALSPAELTEIWQEPQPKVTAYAGQATTRAAAVVGAVITFARKQLGLPYQWGGNGPQRGDAGFDCSGLTQSAFAAGQVSVPRTAHEQYNDGPRVPPWMALRPGDLVFYGTPSRVRHVGLYVGQRLMIHAPTFGQNVQVAHYRWPGDGYLGATRPTEHLGGLGSYLPELPSPLPNEYAPGFSASSGTPGAGTGSASAAQRAPASTTPGAKPAGSSPAPGAAPAPTQNPSTPPLVPLPIPVPLPLPTLPPLPPNPPLLPAPGTNV